MINFLKQRWIWIVVSILYVPMFIFTTGAVFSFSPLGVSKMETLMVVELVVAGRIIIGLYLNEKFWKAVMYLFLPILLAFLTEFIGDALWEAMC